MLYKSISDIQDDCPPSKKNSIMPNVKTHTKRVWVACARVVFVVFYMKPSQNFNMKHNYLARS